MAIYRFRISFEDYDDVIREIDIRSNQTFLDLHHAIQGTTGYNAEQSSSFYVSNDQWIKSTEISYLPSKRKIDQGVATMEKSKLSGFIDDPHQKFYYTYNFERPYDFHVELIKILEEEKGKEYPSVCKNIGEAPKPAGSVIIPPAAAAEDEFDFLNEMEYTAEDAEDMEVLDHDDTEVAEEEAHEDEEKDEFMDEFSDNEGFGDEKEDF